MNKFCQTVIRDSKNKKEGILEMNLSPVEIRTASGISKLRQEEIPIVKLIIRQVTGKFRKIEKK